MALSAGTSRAGSARPGDGSRLVLNCLARPQRTITQMLLKRCRTCCPPLHCQMPRRQTTRRRRGGRPWGHSRSGRLRKRNRAYTTQEKAPDQLSSLGTVTVAASSLTCSARFIVSHSTVLRQTSAVVAPILAKFFCGRLHVCVHLALEGKIVAVVQVIVLPRQGCVAFKSVVPIETWLVGNQTLYVASSMVRESADPSDTLSVKRSPSSEVATAASAAPRS